MDRFTFAFANWSASFERRSNAASSFARSSFSEALRSLTTTVFSTFLSTTRSDNNFVPKGWHDSVSEGGHSPAAQRLAVVDGNLERVSPKISSLKKALWSSVRTYAYIVDVASMASMAYDSHTVAHGAEGRRVH